MGNHDEISLGGCLNDVVKVGDTVHRLVKNQPALHAYLQYLQKAGMSGVPRFLGLDGQGREVLSYLPGKTQEHGYPIDHPCLRSEQTIAGMARFLRRLHDVSEGFLPEALARGWTNPDYPQDAPETICHNDAAVWNFVFVEDRVAGLIDFDKACASTRTWDLTMAVYGSVHLNMHAYDPELDTHVRYEPARHAAGRKHRVGVFFDAYGMDCPPDFMEMVALRIQIDCCDLVTRGAAAGDASCIKLVENGSLAYYRRVTAFIREHGHEWMP